MHSDFYHILKATIASWRLGWNFTAEETIQSPSNVYTPGVDVLALDPPNVQLQASNVNLTIKPFSWTEISFLGTKSTTPVPSVQYKAGRSATSCTLAHTDDCSAKCCVCMPHPALRPG